MKRLLSARPVDYFDDDCPLPARVVPAGAAWNGMTLPAVPSADWPAALALDYAIDRVARDAISSGRSLQEAVTRITELAQSVLPHLTETEIDRRIHAQILANT